MYEREEGRGGSELGNDFIYSINFSVLQYYTMMLQFPTLTPATILTINRHIRCVLVDHPSPCVVHFTCVAASILHHCCIDCEQRHEGGGLYEVCISWQRAIIKPPAELPSLFHCARERDTLTQEDRGLQRRE